MSDPTGADNSKHTRGAKSRLPQAADDDVLPEYEKIGPTQLLPHLFIGCMKDALDEQTARRHGITHVLNISNSCPKPTYLLGDTQKQGRDPDSSSLYLRVPVNDGYFDSLLPYLEKTYDFIEKAKQSNGCVMVHCHAGMSRSATVAIAYMMKHYHMTAEAAHRFVKSKRTIVSPNFNFLGQLLDYEKGLNLPTKSHSSLALQTASWSTSEPGSDSVSSRSETGPSSALKRKRSQDYKFTLEVADPITESPDTDRDVVSTAQPAAEKRVAVDKIHSLSPASAMATLRFEQTLLQNPDLLSPHTSGTSPTISLTSPSQLPTPVAPLRHTLAPLRTDTSHNSPLSPLSTPVTSSPPKRCLSWNAGLATLGRDDSRSPSPVAARSSRSLPKHISRGKRPSSLSLSTTNIPLTLSAHHDSADSEGSVMMRSRTQTDMTSISSRPRSLHNLTTRPGSLFNMALTKTNSINIESPATPYIPGLPAPTPFSVPTTPTEHQAKSIDQSENTESKISRSRSSSQTLNSATSRPDVKPRINHAASSGMSSVYTAPSGFMIESGTLLSDLPQRSRSLEFLSSLDNSNRMCQKCGRHDKSSKCYTSVPRDSSLNISAPNINTISSHSANNAHERSNSLHGSLEIISVS